jgi:hypothetical protein
VAAVVVACAGPPGVGAAVPAFGSGRVVEWTNCTSSPRVGLAATNRYGFALAGGYAVQAHGFLQRPSEDVDLFTVADAQDRFDEAVTAAVEAYRAAGLTVRLSGATSRSPAWCCCRVRAVRCGWRWRLTGGRIRR